MSRVRAALITASPLLLAAVLPLPALAATSTQLDFTVLRNGSEVGHDLIHVARDGEQTHVDIDTHVVVTMAMIPVYRFEHHAHEEWRGQQLVKLDSQTNDDGKKHTLHVSAAAGGLTVDGDGQQSTAPADIVTASLWNPRLTSQHTLLNTLEGTQMPVTVHDAGVEPVEVHGAARNAHHYVLSGGLQRDLWYDASGQLVQVRFKAKDDSEIVYALR